MWLTITEGRARCRSMTKLEWCGIIRTLSMDHFLWLRSEENEYTRLEPRRVTRFSLQKRNPYSFANKHFSKQKKEKSSRTWESGMYMLWIAITWGVKGQNFHIKYPCPMVKQIKIVTWFKGEYCYSRACMQENDVTRAFIFSTCHAIDILVFDQSTSRPRIAVSG